MTTTSTPRPVDRAGHDVRNAWLSVLMLPIAFGLAFLIGEGLIALLGYPVGDTAGDAPLWAKLVATIPALLVLCIPAAVSAWFARRAAAHGDRRGWVHLAGGRRVGLHRDQRPRGTQTGSPARLGDPRRSLVRKPSRYVLGRVHSTDIIRITAPGREHRTMEHGTSTFTPHTVTGWTAAALGLGVIVVVAASYFLSNAVTNGGNEAGPVWLRILVPSAVVAIALPAVVVGLRARKGDRSLLGGIALVISSLIGGWAAFTGIAGFFF